MKYKKVNIEDVYDISPSLDINAAVLNAKRPNLPYDCSQPFRELLTRYDGVMHNALVDVGQTKQVNV